MPFSDTPLSVDLNKGKSQVKVYKRLRQDSYYESANIVLKSIHSDLAKVKESNPENYDEFVNYIGL